MHGERAVRRGSPPLPATVSIGIPASASSSRCSADLDRRLHRDARQRTRGETRSFCGPVLTRPDQRQGQPVASGASTNVDIRTGGNTSRPGPVPRCHSTVVLHGWHARLVRADCRLGPLPQRVATGGNDAVPPELVGSARPAHAVATGRAAHSRPGGGPGGARMRSDDVGPRPDQAGRRVLDDAGRLGPSARSARVGVSDRGRRGS